MLKDSPGSEALTGNERFEGYCVDLIEEIANILGFRYELYPVANNAYGSLKNGEWNGMIRELLDRKADMAIADLTITSGRQSAVDFTLPFMNLGISILFKKPEETPPELFSFLKPFSVEVWLYMATAFLGVSLLLYVISRLSPYEWVSGHPCDDDPEELENQFSLGNCLWFSLGSIMQQGSDLAPRCVGKRERISLRNDKDARASPRMRLPRNATSQPNNSSALARLALLCQARASKSYCTLYTHSTVEFVEF